MLTIHHSDICAGVLVGGRGRRLGGRDKALLQRKDGSTLVEHIVGQLRPRVREVLLVKREEQSFPDLQARQLVDERPDSGPLAGLTSLLDAAPTAWCLLVACDLPAFDGAIVDLLAAARTSEARIVAAVATGRVQPTCALYHRDLIGVARAALAANELSLMTLIDGVPHSQVDLPPAFQASLRNVNRPEDLAALGD